MNKLGGYILYGAVYLFSLLPLWVHYRISDLLYYIVHYIVRYRRTIVRKNLSKAFPEKTDAERRQIEKGFYSFFCDYMVENVKLVTMRKSNVMKHMVFEGMDKVAETLKNHDFLFVYLGHYCNWEYAASLQWWAPKSITCAQLYSALRNDAFDYLFYKIRSRYGGENINKNDALRTIVGYRRSGKKAIVGFISDQVPKWQNIHMWMKFLNQDTPVFTGTERIAKKLDAAVCYADMTRPRRGYYRCNFRIMTENVREFREHELTAYYMQLLERSIIKEPCFWLWSHNRWKRQRPEEDKAGNVQEVRL